MEKSEYKFIYDQHSENLVILMNKIQAWGLLRISVFLEIFENLENKILVSNINVF